MEKLQAEVEVRERVEEELRQQEMRTEVVASKEQ